MVEWQYTARWIYLNHQSHIFHIISYMMISNTFRFLLFKDSFMNKVCQIIINISLITCYLYFKNFHLSKNPVALNKSNEDVLFYRLITSDSVYLSSEHEKMLSLWFFTKLYIVWYQAAIIIKCPVDIKHITLLNWSK